MPFRPILLKDHDTLNYHFGMNSGISVDAEKTTYTKKWWGIKFQKYYILFADLSLIQINFSNMSFFSVLRIVQQNYIFGSRGRIGVCKADNKITQVTAG